MPAVGIISMLTGWVGAVVPYVYFDSPWGGLLTIVMMLCVAMTHDKYLRGRNSN